MLVIFDVDGTLIGGESSDWAAFDQAIVEVLGFQPSGDFYRSILEITGQSIAETAVRASGRNPGQGWEGQICAAYFRGLRRIHETNPHAFQARPGARALLAELRADPEVTVAIATGDWLETISYKLTAAGIDVAGLPMATSSDRACRSDIIRLAAERAGRSVADAIYVGDGAWDLRACRQLKIPFIGTGAKTHLLTEAGARHLHPDFSSGSLRETIRGMARISGHPYHGQFA